MVLHEGSHHCGNYLIMNVTTFSESSNGNAFINDFFQRRNKIQSAQFINEKFKTFPIPKPDFRMCKVSQYI